MRKLICSRYIAVLGFQQPKAEQSSGSHAGGFHPLCRGTWFPTCECAEHQSWHRVSIRYIAVLGFQRVRSASTLNPEDMFPSAISRYLVSNNKIELAGVPMRHLFPSAISRYLVSNPTRKIPPLTSGGGNGLHTPRRIDHIPTFASLNHDKNTRSTHYTPNAGIEFSQAGFAPPGISPGHVT